MPRRPQQIHVTVYARMWLTTHTERGAAIVEICEQAEAGNHRSRERGARTSLARFLKAHRHRVVRDYRREIASRSSS